MKTAVLLPVYNPDEKFLRLCEELHKRGFKVVAVNDGSRERMSSAIKKIRVRVMPLSAVLSISATA